MEKHHFDNERLLDPSTNDHNCSSDNLLLPLSHKTGHSLEKRRYNKLLLIILTILLLSGASYLVVHLSSIIVPSLSKHSAHGGSNTVPSSNIGLYSKKPLSSLVTTKADPRAKDVRIHFLNHHPGTSNEMDAIARAISEKNNVKITVTETRGIDQVVHDLHVSKEASDEYWETAKELECNADQYDMIIVGDTMSLLRPHLQNCCQLKLVSLLTTRFDWAHWSDVEWRDLLGNASRWNNFKIYPNNLIEEWYAKWRGADMILQNYLPSSGIPSKLWSKALEDVDSKISQPDDRELIVPMSVRIEECLTSELQARNINFTEYQRFHYGGPLGLTDRTVVHFPYQSNTMALFENLHQRVVYVLPSLRLFREMGPKCEASIESIPNENLTDEDFYTKIDWYRRDLQHLFFYFDSFDDLKEGSDFRKQILREAELKRVLIAEYMLRQREYVLNQWEDLLFGEWTNQGKADDQCFLYQEQSFISAPP